MNKIGIVFSGGGGKGAYQVGVWKAFLEYGLDKKVSGVSGTSVGALNASLFCMDQFETAERIWRTISREKILTPDPTKVLKEIERFIPTRFGHKIENFNEWVKTRGVFSRDGLSKIINENVDLAGVRVSPIVCFATCFNSRTSKPEYFRLNDYGVEKMETILLASSALPLVFDQIEIDGDLYLDGGLGDNVPIKPLYDLGCDLIFVIHLNRTNLVDHTKYPDAKVIEILPRNHQGGMLNGTLDFSPGSAERRMLEGYEDAIRMIAPVFNMASSQNRFVDGMNALKDDEENFKTSRNDILSERDALKRNLNQYFKKG